MSPFDFVIVCIGVATAIGVLLAMLSAPAKGGALDIRRRFPAIRWIMFLGVSSIAVLTIVRVQQRRAHSWVSTGPHVLAVAGFENEAEARAAAVAIAALWAGLAEHAPEIRTIRIMPDTYRLDVRVWLATPPDRGGVIDLMIYPQDGRIVTSCYWTCPLRQVDLVTPAQLHLWSIAATMLQDYPGVTIAHPALPWAASQTNSSARGS